MVAVSLIVVMVVIGATHCWEDPAGAAPDGGPDYSTVELLSVSLPSMVEALPNVWVAETDLPAFRTMLRGVALWTGSIEVDGELVPWSPHRDLIVFTLKPCETGSMSWHERGGSAFLGPLQYVLATWLSLDPPTRWPWDASITDQVDRTERLVARSGGTFSQFPGCRARWHLP